MRKVFQDPLLEDHFEKNGYVKIQLLNTAQIEALTLIYSDVTQDNSPIGFFSTAGENATIKQSIHQLFSPYFLQLWTTILFDYKPVFSNFITKKTADSTIAYHQDWAFMDESTGKCSLNIWCPLVDTFHDNGNLAVIPGFHYLTHQLRTSNHHYSPYNPYQDYLKEIGIELPTLAGEAIIFDNALMHASTPNMGETNRLTTSMLAIPKEEQIVIHHFSTDRKTINLYKVNDDYLLNNNLFIDVPEEKFLFKTVPFEPPVDPLSELKELRKKQLQKALIIKPRKRFFKNFSIKF